MMRVIPANGNRGWTEIKYRRYPSSGRQARLQQVVRGLSPDCPVEIDHIRPRLCQSQGKKPAQKQQRAHPADLPDPGRLRPAFPRSISPLQWRMHPVQLLQSWASQRMGSLRRGRRHLIIIGESQRPKQVRLQPFFLWATDTAVPTNLPSAVSGGVGADPPKFPDGSNIHHPSSNRFG